MGLALAGSFALKLYILFAIGAVTMRAAGCIINDMADRDFDAKVERTKSRPLASGQISMLGASVFLAILLLIGLLILIQLPMIAVFVGLCSIPLFVIYPFMKRFTYWPQFFLGLTFNIGILVAYAASGNCLHIEAFLLYFGAVFWTLGYDTIYAHQDKNDDMQIGVKSTALFLGDKSKFFITVFYALFLAMFFIATSIKANFGLVSIILFLAAASHFAWQVWRLNINDGATCLKLFKSNTITGLLLVATLLAASAGF